MRFSLPSRLVLLVHLLFLAAVLPVASQTPEKAESAPDQTEGIAQTGDESELAEGQIWYDQVVVAATRSDRAAGEIPFHATVLATDVVRIAPDSGVADLLRKLPSLEFHSDQGNLAAEPRDGGISMRGLGGAQGSRALALVDGLPIVDPYAGYVVWSQVPKEFIDGIEIVRGGGSSAWGNLALSGVVNLVTVAPSDRRFAATVRTGSKSTRDISASYSDVGGPWAGWVSGNYFDTDGYYKTPEELRTVFDEPSKRQYQSLNGRLSYTISPSASLRLGALAYDEERDEGAVLERGASTERLLFTTLDKVRDSGAAWQFKLFGRESWSQTSNGSYEEDGSALNPLNDIFDLPGLFAGLNGVWNSAPGPRHSLVAGGDLQYIAVERNENLAWEVDRFTANYHVEGKQQISGFFLQDNITFSSRLSVLLAGRFDRIRNYDGTSVRTDLLTGDVIREDILTENTESSFNPTVGFVYAAAPSSRIRASAYTGFRGATPSELFVGFISRGNRITVANPALAPETLVGVEAGYDYTPGSRFSARFTGFWNEIEDMIERVTAGRVGPEGGVIEPCGFFPSSGSCSQRRNLGKARTAGLEVDGGYQPANFWFLNLAATLMDTEILENPDDPELVGNRLERAAEEQVLLGVQYANPRLFQALLRTRYVSERFNDAENEEPLPAFLLVDLSIARQVTPKWEVFGGVENAFDEIYVTRYRSAGPEIAAPRLFHIGFRFTSR